MRENRTTENRILQVKSDGRSWHLRGSLSDCSNLLRTLKPGLAFSKDYTVYVRILLHMARLKLRIIKEMHYVRCTEIC